MGSLLGTLEHSLEQRHLVDVGVGDDRVPDSVPVDGHCTDLKKMILRLRELILEIQECSCGSIYAWIRATKY